MGNDSTPVPRGDDRRAGGITPAPQAGGNISPICHCDGVIQRSLALNPAPMLDGVIQRSLALNPAQCYVPPMSRCAKLTSPTGSGTLPRLPLALLLLLLRPQAQ
jgi:hypothetical protein